ncbi:dapper homolog 3 [Mustela lutreola]|uniref:dapper homolog 3 n=1 Tax=Mustela lutreola TaxID=9666 RepID=UPI00279722DD|nr:dapper homolog 3 [Mustela lutreola]
MHFTARPFTVKAREPGLRTGLSFPLEKGTRGAGLSRGAGRGLTRIAAPEPPLTPAPPTPDASSPRGAPRRCPPRHPGGRAAAWRRHLASPRAGSHSPWAFTFSPRPCRLLRRISRSRRRRRRTSRGPDGRRLRIHAAGAERAARGQRARSPRARGRASAELELQPPPFRSSPHRRPARGCRAGAPTGDPWRPPAEWQLREVRSPGGSSCLPQSSLVHADWGVPNE